MRKDYLIGANTIIPDYFCITPIEGETEITWKVSFAIPTQSVIQLDMQYSFDKLNWTTLQIASTINQTNIYDTITTSVPVYFRGNNKYFNRTDTQINNGHVRVDFNKLCDLSGKIGTLSSPWKTNAYMNGINYVFRSNTKIHSIKDLILNIRTQAILDSFGTILYQSYNLDYMFADCTALIDTPKFDITGNGILNRMFQNCTNLETLPRLSMTDTSRYSYMFRNCSKINLSETQTGDYQTEYRIPYNAIGTGTPTGMFESTGGTFTGTPNINTTYYTSNQVL